MHFRLGKFPVKSDQQLRKKEKLLLHESPSFDTETWRTKVNTGPMVTCILWNVFHGLHFLCSAATLLGSGTIQAAPECSINVFPWASSQLTKNWLKYSYYFLCLLEFSVPVWLGLRNANTKKKLKTVKLEQIKWIQVWKTAGKMKLNSQWIILKGKCSRWLHKDYSKDWTSIRTEPTRGWGAGGVKRRNTGERNEWKNTRNSGKSW